MSVKLTSNITMWTRRDWGALAMTSDPGVNANPREAYIHHTADPLAEHLDTLAEMKATMRGYQRYHQRVHGWADIGYHYVVFQPYGHLDYARVFQGRGAQFIPAAQEGHNRGTIAIAVVGDFQHDDGVKRNTRYAIELILKRHPTVTKLGGHRNAPGQSTDCPGDTMIAQLPTIARASRLELIRPNLLGPR